jgi:hypothetical protein
MSGRLSTDSIRSTTIVQNMTLKLNMKDINKILAKAHFKCNLFLNDAKKQHIFAGNMSL